MECPHFDRATFPGECASCNGNGYRIPRYVSPEERIARSIKWVDRRNAKRTNRCRCKRDKHVTARQCFRCQEGDLSVKVAEYSLLEAVFRGASLPGVKGTMDGPIAATMYYGARITGPHSTSLYRDQPPMDRPDWNV